jgi:hypothetical protein
MQTAKLADGQVTVQLNVDDISLLNNALNEVCNGVHLSDPDFETRLGVSRAKARDLLRQIHDLLVQSRG